MQEYPNNSYPSEEDLTTIENWDSFNDPFGLIEFLVPIFEEYGKIKRYDFIDDTTIQEVVIITGGWSGNENAIEALSKNIFWSLYWEKSERGGKYTFHVFKMKGAKNE